MNDSALLEEEKSYRLLVENFASKEEVAAMLKFAKEAVRPGDGYRGDTSPHAEGETFSGYTFKRSKYSAVPGYALAKKVAVKARGKGVVDEKLIALANSPGHELGLKLMLRARKQLMENFGLKELWLEYGHLVMREATGPNVEESVDKLSHPWHYDNQDKLCEHRTHTALLYLNDDFEGGKTLFEKTAFGPEREIQPKPGTLAGFVVDDNNHAVSRLTKGKRYLIAMWFSVHPEIKGLHDQIFG